MKYQIPLLLFIINCFSNLSSQKVIELTSVTTDIVWDKTESQYFSPQVNDDIVVNVSQPTLTAFLPEASIATGTALIIAPGGGFHFLSIENEGNDVAKWCVENGIAAFVLRYRVIPTAEDAVKEFFTKVQNRDRMDTVFAPLIALSKADGLAAIEYVRKNAKAYNVKPDQIGIMGFSAGGTVATAAAFEYTSQENRPSFSVPVYPALHVVNMERLPEKPMPMFIAVTSDDIFGFQTQAADLYKQWNSANQPIELHIYEKGQHGFGMKKQDLPSDKWIDAFRGWLSFHGWL